ncbi:PREDICTED: uncharacterized protein LOC100640935 [Amphimedon queenslandica]|uniref:DDE Tnp4 domain-containing protein n=1 Tax=Amphimedon queenslandica TaxID=400682 RepID=A0AAN0IQY2_AMPQE|nr:PREDICTED: uncharacterized protein LOC100640935 [Amphimedon queenslandica]|eukprot:XP_011406655.1 PREDICTED: uncharacterized protein LOC100640935 [Amphimedon queenslandica]
MYITVPTTTSKWKEIATGFETYWQFPHCIGALDGKHIVIRPPPNSGSYYFNYKHTFSIVLLALVDADYKFTYVNIGCNGRNSSLCAALETNSLNVPLPFPICEDGIPLPYMIVADEAFPLKTYIQKPYAQIGLTKEKRIFNYCLSRARRIVENAFGILANRFQVFMTPIRLSPDKAETIVKTCLSPPGSVDAEDTTTYRTIQGSWRTEKQPTGIIDIERQGSNNYTAKAKEIRDYLCEYFNSDKGALPWQDKMI